MANEVHELAVSIHPEGIDETQEGLDDVSKSFEDTADDVGESTGMLSDFASKFKGAGIIFAGAFGTMIAAVASKMPIIEENASALDAVLIGLGLRMDKLTREDVSPLNRALFRLGNALGMAEDARALAEGFNILALAIEAIPDFAKIGTGLDGLKQGFITLSLLLRSDAIPSIDDLKSSFASAAQTIIDDVTDMIDQIAGDFKHFITTKIPALKAGFGGVVDFLKGLKTKVKNAVTNNILNPAINLINDLISKINNLPGINIGMLETLETTDTTTTRTAEPPGRVGVGRQTGVVDRGPALESGGQTMTINTTVETNIDSKTVAKETKPFTVRGALGRGRGARMR